MPRPSKIAAKVIENKPPEERQVLEWLSTPSGLVEGVGVLSNTPIELDEWQRLVIDTRDHFTCVNKSRQTGFSFAVACRGWAWCYLSPPHSYTMILSSYNLADAREKIRYVNMLDECVPDGERMKREVDNKTDIEFSNGNRIVTMFMPRGKGPADVVLDELAHITDDRLVLQAALPVTSRGGCVVVGSSPLGKGGTFHDIWTGADGKFGGFKRIMVPWWASKALCRDVSVATAEATEMPTWERVERFGTEAIQQIFENSFLEDFQTEYECAWSDESTAFLSWELIEHCSPTTVGDLVERIMSIAMISTLKGEVYVGMDVGRRINATEFSIGEKLGTGLIEERLRVTMQNKPLNEQQEFAEKILQHPNVRRFTVDYTGLGLHLGDALAAKYGSRVKLCAMSGVTKPQVAANIRAMMERDQFKFYPDRDVRQQFHSVKRVATPSGNVVFDVDRNEKHHADKFWASALMLWGAADFAGAGRPCIIRVRTRPDGSGTGGLQVPLGR